MRRRPTSNYLGKDEGSQAIEKRFKSGRNRDEQSSEVGGERRGEERKTTKRWKETEDSRH